MIRQIAPQFFTTEMAATLAYYKDTLGFDCVGTWDDPPVYAIVGRDEHRIHFRLADPPTPNPENTPTNSSTPTCSSRTRTRYTPSMSRAESSSREPLATRPGTRGNLS